SIPAPRRCTCCSTPPTEALSRVGWESFRRTRMATIEVATDGTVKTPKNPTIPYIEGDGTGRDIWRASVRVFDAAVEKSYKGERKIEWLEVLAGEKAFKSTANWLPDETVEAFKKY